MRNKRAHFGWFFALIFGLTCCAVGADAVEKKLDPGQWRAVAEKGDAEGQFQYSELLSGGKGVPGDDFEALVYLRKSASQGYAKAQAALGQRYKSGRGVEQDIVEGLLWLEKAAEQGELTAQTTVALCYLNGDGTPRNEVNAAKWLQRASKAGSRFAESTLNGLQLRGSPKTDDEAATAYRALALRGDVTGLIAYAACLEEGRGLPKNPSEAAKWYLLAAKKGDLLAKYRLGILLQAKAETQAEAFEWLSIAGIEGIGAARSAAGALEKKLTTEQLAAAQSHVKERAKPPMVAEASNPGAGVESVLGALLNRNLARTPMSSGTGFFISQDGYLVTNHHVVDGGRRFEIQRGETKLPAKVVRTSASNDLAVLKVEGEFPALEILSSDRVELGDAVLTVGFPRPRVQGLSPKLSRGEIGSLQGLRDDPTQFQVSLPLQPGNSGGALVNKDGKVIGVVQSVLRGSVALLDNDSAPQSVNYAVKSKHLLELLGKIPESQKLPAKPVENREAMSPIKQAESAAVLIWVYEE